MADTTSDPDVIFNRLNIAFARSQRVLNSWVPAKSDAQETKQEEDDLPEEEFKSMTEKPGLDSKVAYADDDDLLEGSIQRKKLASNEKLLEQLLGSKAAQAKKKSKEPGKSMSASRHAAPKQLTTRQNASREVNSEDDDEGGRAAAFKSNQPKHRKPGNLDPTVDGDRMDVVFDVDDEKDAAISESTEQRSPPVVSSNTEQKATKRKPTSYLDEMLVQRANKKSKKKKSKLKQTT